MGNVAVVFVQLVTSQADSGLQYWRISQGACEVFLLFLNALFVYSFGSSHLVNVCYDVGCGALILFVL